MKRKTKMAHWRGGPLEFGTETRFDAITKPPWYVIRLSGFVWAKPWFYWIDYLGPPVVFLTRRRANQKAKLLRKQYSKAKVEVVKIGPLN